ncbi:MAG: hypothetical protein J5851_00215 [Oscillospiraceae bacterium]|nr:hypothetical protein [Oscillospiraceae bacterium]
MVTNILIAIVVGIIIAAIIIGIQVSALKSVNERHEASDYVKQGSLQLSQKTDVFLYKKLEKTEKPQNNQG